MSARQRTGGAVLVALGILLALATVVIPLIDPGGVADSNSESLLDAVFLAFPGAAFFAVGAVLARRRSQSSVGWLCLTIGLLWLALGALNAATVWAANSGELELAGWLGIGQSTWVPAVGLMGTHLPLRLPDGSLPSARWRWYSRYCTLAIALAYVLVATEPGAVDIPRVESPIASADLQSLAPLFVLFPLAFLGAIGSLVARYRRARGIERLQLRWIALGGVAFLAVYVVSVVIKLAFISDGSGPADTLTTYLTFVAYAAIPIAIAVATLRYRLYDIDVVINRALVYGALTATLAVAYLSSVLLLQVVLSAVSDESGIAVAASTLAVAALFRPARTRVQAAVDRRFYRRKYDAQRTLEAFSGRLRDKVDLAALSTELNSVVSETLQPAHVSLWLRRPESGDAR